MSTLQYPGHVEPLYVPGVTYPVAAVEWMPSYRPEPKRRTSQRHTYPYISFTALPSIPEPGNAGNSFQSTYLLQYQGLFEPHFVQDTTSPAPASSWQGRYPSFIIRKRFHASQQQAWYMDHQWGEPSTQPLPDPFTGPLYPDAIARRHRKATYVWAQPMFGFETVAPVMSWTGEYLTPPMRRTHQQRQPGTVAPQFVADVTERVPGHSWFTKYPDFARPKRGLTSANQRAWTMDQFDAPSSVTVPDQSWASYYPAVVYPKAGLHAAHHRAWSMDEIWSAPTGGGLPFPRPLTMRYRWAFQYTDYAATDTVA